MRFKFDHPLMCSKSAIFGSLQRGNGNESVAMETS